MTLRREYQTQECDVSGVWAAVDPNTARVGLSADRWYRPADVREVHPIGEGPVSPELSIIFDTNTDFAPLEPSNCVDLPTSPRFRSPHSKPLPADTLQSVEIEFLGLVDWFSGNWAVAECPELLRDGSLLRLDEDGQLVREVLLKTRIKSSETSVGVFWHGGRLHFDGNPLKWMSGQNVVGTWDLKRLFDALILALSHYLVGDVAPFTYHDVTVTRLDLTQMIPANTADEARYITRCLGGCLHSHLRKRNPYLIGEGSKWFKIKWYHKGDEIRDNSKKNPLIKPEKIDQFWRFEIEVHRLYLKKHGLNRLSWWINKPTQFGDTMLDIISSLDISIGNADPIPLDVYKTPKDRMLFRSWFAGDDIFEGVSRMTKYRTRKRYMKLYDIDLFLHPATIDKGNLQGGKVLSFAWAQLKRQCESQASFSHVVEHKMAANY